MANTKALVELALENSFLREQLHKRLRFAWALFLMGILVGFVLTIICTMPPVTFGPEVWS